MGQGISKASSEPSRVQELDVGMWDFVTYLDSFYMAVYKVLGPILLLISEFPLILHITNIHLEAMVSSMPS